MQIEATAQVLQLISLHEEEIVGFARTGHVILIQSSQVVELALERGKFGGDVRYQYIRVPPIFFEQPSIMGSMSTKPPW